MSRPLVPPTPPARLSLRVELFILTHSEAGEPLAHRPSLSIGLAGAILASLVVPVERVRLVGGSAATVVDRQPTGDSVADWALAGLAGHRSPLSVQDALRQIATEAYERTAADMVGGGLVTETSRRRLFGRTVAYPPANSAIIPRVRGRLRYVMQGIEQADPQTDILAGLIRALGLESEMYLDAVGNDLRAQMRQMLNRAAAEYPAMKEIVKAVEALVAEAALAVYR
ncbi:hypothetical protein GCM10027290_65370 [Micromonospora sonneratiae]|uniref:GPP34 family phosphoprotein n=1 Tax=Micromonospora sonneratiae TaxID=1184706 RepID=A0ABW3YNE1_9ACTN